jgi:hypothetical protein
MLANSEYSSADNQYTTSPRFFAETLADGYKRDA